MSVCRFLRAACVAVLFVVAVVADSNITNCVAGLGAAMPMPTCNATYPCVNLLSTYAAMGVTNITTPQTVPTLCAARFNGTLYNDGAPTAIDVPGQPTDPSTPTTRYYCKYVPSSASPSRQVPLILFFDGSGGTATAPYRQGIRPWAASGIPGVFGGSPFAVIGLQALNRHWPPSGAIGPGEDGTKNDYFFRNISQNDDIRYADAVIDALVATGTIDRTRIYVMGYSNGAYFSMFYGAVRSGSTNYGQWTINATGMTPGGNVIAAAAPFSGADPFHSSSCWYNPEGQSKLPVQITLYLCDVVPCSAASAYISMLQSSWQSINATIIPLNTDGTVGDMANCNATGPPDCTSAARQTNHGNFPTWRVTQMITFLSSFTSANLTTSTTNTSTTSTIAPSTTLMATTVAGTSSTTVATTAVTTTTSSVTTTTATGQTTSSPSPSTSSAPSSTATTASSSASNQSTAPSTLNVNTTGMASSTAQSTTVVPVTTAVPPTTPTPQGTGIIAAGTMRISGTAFGILLGNASLVSVLTEGVRRDLATLLKTATDNIVINSLRVGSLLVDFSVTSGALANNTATAISNAITSAAPSSSATPASASWLTNTAALYSTVANDTLSVTSASVVVATTASPSGASNSLLSTSACGNTCIGFYAAVAVGCVVVVGVAAAVILVTRRRRANAVRDGDATTSPPTAHNTSRTKV